MKTKQFYTSAQAAEAAEKYKKHQGTISALAKEYNVSVSTMHKALLTFGVLRTKGEEYKTERRLVVADLFKTGCTPTEIAHQVGLSYTWVIRILQEFYGPDWQSVGQAAREKPALTDEQRREIARMWVEERTTQAFIKNKYGCTRSDIDQAAVEFYGVDWRKTTRRGQQLTYQQDYYNRMTYGIALADREALYQEQAGTCAICCRPFDLKDLHTDHDHKTGKVRGLLCSQCNQALGKMDDSPSRLRAAADYLEQHT